MIEKGPEQREEEEWRRSFAELYYWYGKYFPLFVPKEGFKANGFSTRSSFQPCLLRIVHSPRARWEMQALAPSLLKLYRLWVPFVIQLGAVKARRVRIEMGILPSFSVPKCPSYLNFESASLKRKWMEAFSISFQPSVYHLIETFVSNLYWKKEQRIYSTQLMLTEEEIAVWWVSSCYTLSLTLVISTFHSIQCQD